VKTMRDVLEQTGVADKGQGCGGAGTGYDRIQRDSGRHEDSASRRVHAGVRITAPTRNDVSAFALDRHDEDGGGFHVHSGDIEADALREGKVGAVVDGVGGPAHVLLPCVGAGFTAATGFFFTAEGSSDLRA
jgi:hypothetical protein